MTAEAVPLAPAPEGWTIEDVDGLLEPAEHVRAVVEVVSRSSRSDDRFRKPAQYAQAGIPIYVRVELDPPHIVAYGIGADGLHVEIGRAEPGQRVDLTEPFPISLDPAALLR